MNNRIFLSIPGSCPGTKCNKSPDWPAYNDYNQKNSTQYQYTGTFPLYALTSTSGILL